jgi:hypothetical protein
MKKKKAAGPKGDPKLMAALAGLKGAPIGGSA